MRIVFMGTPEFGVPSLNALLDAGCAMAMGEPLDIEG